ISLMQITLSPLTVSEVSAAHAAYNRCFDWLTAKGVRQWLLRLDHATYAKRQAAGEAFAIQVDGVLAGCVFVPFETISYYGDELNTTPRWWMHTLVIDRAFAGRGPWRASCRSGVRSGAYARRRFSVVALRQ
ncbi:MAG: hypothetical protein H7203_09490, partial [Rhizobacter sp.]|nr:hypothetical protein [Burkholderiales bacterium]